MTSFRVIPLISFGYKMFLMISKTQQFAEIFNSTLKVFDNGS